MLKKVINKFKQNPQIFYAMSIASTWANAGSLLNGITTAQSNGIIPYILWAIGNTLSCIVFGLAACKITKLREVFKTRIMKIIMGIMCPFQCWISMNGIQTVFSETLLGPLLGKTVAIIFAIIFIIMLLKNGMIRNVISDHFSWISVYAIIFLLTIIVLISSNGEYVNLELGMNDIFIGLKNMLLLIPGAFLYPYYYELLDYNDKNDNNVNRINIQKTFILGGLLFGIYLIFIFLMSLTKFGVVASIVKAILVTLIAISSLSSFLYSIVIIFGKKIGTVINILTVLLWQLLIPLGVMGAWTLMASIRIYIVLGAIIASYIWWFVSKRQTG